MTKTVTLLIALLAGSALGSGFRLETHHARAAGMGIAVTALTSDASSIVYNPAGLAGRKGFDLQLGVTLVVPSVVFTADASGQRAQTLTRVSTPINFNVAWGLTDDLSIGLGVFNPFGAGATWPDGWEGRGRALSSNVQTFAFNPTVAYRVHPRFKIGAGLQLLRGTVGIERALPFVDSEGKVSLGGDAWGVGWNAGVQGTLIEDRLTFGFTWRSNVPLTFAGRAHFGGVPPELQARLADQPITASITLPDVATVGLGFFATPRLRFGLDVNAVTWSSFRQLFIDFESNDLDNPLPKRWRDTLSVHLGAEYDVTARVQARFGAVYDEAATPTDTLTPDLPDAARARLCAGVGYRFDVGVNLDLGYQFVLLVPQVSHAPGFSGTYAGSAQVVGLNAGGRW
ncbi:MAG: outer membrane protein transport protein [Myxococcus sp.]|nr:outer membrane protein transport protein [Myxococcus sp.]